MRSISSSAVCEAVNWWEQKGIWNDSTSVLWKNAECWKQHSGHRSLKESTQRVQKSYDLLWGRIPSCVVYGRTAEKVHRMSSRKKYEQAKVGNLNSAILHLNTHISEYTWTQSKKINWLNKLNINILNSYELRDAMLKSKMRLLRIPSLYRSQSTFCKKTKRDDGYIPCE